MARRAAGRRRRLADRSAACDPRLWQRHRHAARGCAALHARHAALRVRSTAHLACTCQFRAVRGGHGHARPPDRWLSRVARRAHRLERAPPHRSVHARADTDAVGAADQRLDPAARTQERHGQPDRARLVRTDRPGAGHLFVLGHGLGRHAAGAAARVSLAVARVSRAAGPTRISRPKRCARAAAASAARSPRASCCARGRCRCAARDRSSSRSRSTPTTCR